MQSFAQQRSGRGACHITKLPYELVLAVAHWTEHPADIVSLSLASKYFYRVLVVPPPDLSSTTSTSNPTLANTAPINHAEVTWRKARERMSLITQVDKIAPNPRLSEAGREWGAVRIQWTGIPIPAPYQGMREADLMMILFGPKVCCECRRTFSETPLMIGLGEFWCKGCKIEPHLLSKELANHDLAKEDKTYFETIWASLPRVDTPSSTFSFGLSLSKTSKRAWNTILEQWNAAKTKKRYKEFLYICQDRINLMKSRTGRANTLNRWLENYYKHVGYINTAFKASAEIWARGQNIEMEDLHRAPPYRHLTSLSMHGRILSIEDLLTPSIEDRILDEVSKIHSNRVGRTVAKAISTRRADISTLYREHRFQDNVKPSWSTYRSIPIIKAMQNSFAPPGVKIEREKNKYSYDPTEPVSDKIGISSALKRNGNLDLLDVAVAKWRVEAVKGARQLLGYDVESPSKSKKRRTKKRQQAVRKNLKFGITFLGGMEVDQGGEEDDDHTDNEEEEESTEQVMDGTTSVPPVAAPVETMEVDSTTQKKVYKKSPGKLDPEMRITTWFSCIKCHTYDAAYKRLKVLDFRGMCSHECVQKDKKKKDRSKWSIRNFILAPRAIETTRKMLKILELEEDDPKASQSALSAQKWICNNCPPTVRTLYWEDLIRHCLRHPSQDISVASKEQEEERARLPDGRRAPCSFADLVAGKYDNEAIREQFGCVHCHPSILTRNVGAIEGRGEGEREKKTKGMKFHGMRQHMKAKHSIEDVRNEDFYFLAEGLFERAEPIDDDMEEVPIAMSTAKGKGHRLEVRSLLTGKRL